MPSLAPPTPGLRLMLWSTPTLTTYLGLAYLLGNGDRYSSPAYLPAKHLLPMHAWGVVFIVLGVSTLLLVATGKAQAALAAICVGLGLYLFWAIVFLAAIINPGSPLTAFAYQLLVAVLHLAMLMSLTGITFHLPRLRRRRRA